MSDAMSSPEVTVHGKIQQKIDLLKVPYVKSLHTFSGVSEAFKPWAVDLSPSALYNCSVTCRKAMKLKTPELKWTSIKRWMTESPSGIKLPDGCYISIKRKEVFVASPTPHLEKKDFILVMFPYGNVWSQQSPEVPITEEWLWTEKEGISIFEMLLHKDAANPITGYFASCYEFMIKNPDQIGIHLKRRKKMK